MPTFWATRPQRMVCSSSLIPLGAELDLDVDAGGEVELHQRVHRLRRRIDDVEHALVRTNLELLARLLVDVRRAIDRELLDARRQRNGTAHLCARPLGRADDLAGRLIEHAMIEGFEPDPDIGVVHRHDVYPPGSFAVT